MRPFPASYEAQTEAVVSGTTATPSQIRVTLVKTEDGGRQRKAAGKSIRVRLVNTGTLTNSTNGTIALSADVSQVTEVTADKEYIVKELAAAYAAGTLTLTGVIKHGETVTIGSRIYQFVAGAAATGSNVGVDISGTTVAAAGTLTLDTQPTAGDTMSIGNKVYTFVALGTGDIDGEIALGANLAATKPLVIAAINGTDAWNTANTLVSAAAFSGDDSVITSRIEGTVGNAYTSTETFTAGTNVFDATTLGTTTAGADCAAGAAITALVAAITGDDQAVVTAVDGAGDTVVATSILVGVAGNDYASTTTMANASWGASKLTGGIDAPNGTMTFVITDATAETIDLIVSDDVSYDGIPFAHVRLPVTHGAP